MSYVERVIEQVKAKNAEQPEFIQAVTEVLTSLEPVIEAHPEYEAAGLLERIVEPERVIMFRVPWVDDEGKVQVNRGFRVQFNSCLGPYKGGLRLHPSVNLGIIKFLGFEQIFKNSLTTLPMGGGKGGCDFDPKGKSDVEVMRFCQSFMTELCTPHRRRHRRAGRRHRHGRAARSATCSASTSASRTSGKACSRARACPTAARWPAREATGYGLVYFVQEYLNCHDDDFAGKTVAVSGSGNVAIYATREGPAARRQGGHPVRLHRLDPRPGGHRPGPGEADQGSRARTHQRIRQAQGRRGATTTAAACGACRWTSRCRAPRRTNCSSRMRSSWSPTACKIVAEGANMPTTMEATDYLMENGVVFCPGKAANAGGVATSGLEMSQNSERLSWTFEEVDAKLQGIMKNIYHAADDAAKEFGHEGNYVMGANIAGFKKLADAMMAQGIV